MWRWLFAVVTVMGLTVVASAQQEPALPQDEEAEYRQVIDRRATGIVEGLDLDDPAREQKVHAILVGYYPKLREYHEEKGPKVRELEQEARRATEAGNESAAESAQMQVESLQQARQELRDEFVGQLKEVLSEEEINRVKDGMTYGLVQHRMEALSRIDLSEEQKKQVEEILVAAREEAFDEAGSREKHAAFRRAMGRISVRVLTEEQRAQLAERE
jgi:hypothetical protein